MPDEKSPTLPPPPQTFHIPQAAIDRWVAIPERATITATFTRQDIDNLFFAISRTNQSINSLQQCMIQWSQGRTDEANKHLFESERLNTEGNNFIRMFINAIMASANLAGNPNG